jgi:plastocyanin
MRRRQFLATAGGATAAAATAGTAGAQESKTVQVGPGGELVYTPETLYVSPGTTVVFEWGSDNHNVVVESQPEGANWEGTPGAPEETYDTGYTYEHTFETLGEYSYFCQPHKGVGMVATIVVNEAGAPPSGGESGPVNPEEMGVAFQAHYVGIATILAIALSVVFGFYVLKYGESPHASSPNRK